MAWSAETAGLDLRFIAASCVQNGDRIECSGPEQPLPATEIELNTHDDGRQLETWTGSYSRQLDAEGHLFDVKISVTKRFHKLFRTTSYEVNVSAKETGKPLSGVDIKFESSHVSVNSTLKNLNLFTVDGPKVVESARFWYPRVHVAASANSQTGF